MRLSDEDYKQFANAFGYLALEVQDRQIADAAYALGMTELAAATKGDGK